MRGFLKNSSDIFQLAPKVTTVGREGCDLNIPNSGVDYQHAVIEFNDIEQCYVLEDLNTTQGTFVNGCKVNNAAVRLVPGDTVQFAMNTQPYTLELEQPAQVVWVPYPHRVDKWMKPLRVSYPPVNHRQAWTQPLTVISDTHPSEVHIQYGDTLPQLANSTHITQVTTNRTGRPSAATIRARPMSATLRRNEPMYDRQQNGFTADRPSSGYAKQNRSIVGGARLTCRTNSASSACPNIDLSAIRKKDEEIQALTEELRQLNLTVMDFNKKDDLIHQLREEIADLQMKLRRQETSHPQPIVTTTDPNLSERLAYTEQELHQKRVEIQTLREELLKLQEESAQVNSDDVDSLRDRTAELASLRSELEKVKKEKNLISGLVSQMQRDMANKDTSISRLSRDLEAAKRDLNDKEVQIKTLQTKVEEWQKSSENKDAEGQLQSTVKELTELKMKVRSCETNIDTQKMTIEQLQQELNKKTQKADEALLQKRSLEVELDKTKAACQDLERTERMVRIDMEQLTKRLDRLRQRVVQTTFSTPGFKAPTKELQDDEVVEELKKVIAIYLEIFQQLEKDPKKSKDDRTKLRALVQELQDQYQNADKSRKSLTEGTSKAQKIVSESVERLSSKGFLSCHIKQEVDLLNATTFDEEELVCIKTAFCDTLVAMQKWQEETEAALEECQINVKISEEAPAVHIRKIYQQVSAHKEDLEKLRTEMSRLSEEYEKERKTTVENITKELKEKHKVEQEQMKSGVEEQVTNAVEEAVRQQQEDHSAIVRIHEEKVQEYEASIEQLKQRILAMEEEQSTNKETAGRALEEKESSLRQIEELQAMVRTLEEDKEKISQEKQQEVEQHKEQVKQHSVTICALEERLNKVMMKNKDYQAEISTLKGTIEDLRKKPSIPPKPSVVQPRPLQDVLAMESLIAQLRHENQELHKQNQEQQEVMVGLRRDLAGASARLTDMTGELSEAQKQEMERQRHLIKMQDGELTECRQQLAKLSQVVDQQAEEITRVNEELTRYRESTKKLKTLIVDRENRIKELEEELVKEKDANKKNLTLLEEEGRISSELTALGAQCRGERHEQVINRQREALAELRSKVRTLEHTNPTLPSSDQALQQVVILKQELAELRAAQARSESLSRAFGDSSVLAQQVSRARGIEPQQRVESDMERSAHRETLDSLEESERTYLSLLRSISGALELDEVPGLQSLAHLPRDERERVAAQRDQAMEMMASRIRLLRERIQRKDDLLQGYERDLAKLRQAEQLADHKDSQVELLSSDLRGRTEELDYLRETLQRTKEKLEQEKRLNSSIKQKKTFHMEGNTRYQGVWSKHRCFPDDNMGTKQAHKNAAKEKFKKKDYEIRVLKSELAHRDNDLDEVKRRLLTAEATRNQYMEAERELRSQPVHATPPESVGTTEIY